MPPKPRLPLEVAERNPAFARDEEVFTVSTVILVVVNVPCPSESSLVVPPIWSTPPFAMFNKPFKVEEPAVIWPDELTLNWEDEETWKSTKFPLKRVEVGMFNPMKVPEA